MELEQSTVRISICNNEIDAEDECGDLQTQVVDMQENNPEKACSAFGLGPVTGASEKPPTTCATAVPPAGSTDATSSSTGHAEIRKKGVHQLMVILGVFMATLAY